MFLTQAVANNGFPFEIKKKTVNPYVISDMRQDYENKIL